MGKPTLLRTTLLFALITAALVTGCGQSEPASSQPPFKPVASLEQVMHDVIFPSAEVVWESVGTIISYEGTEEIYPRSDEEWIAVQSSATILTEAGNLLMMEGRAQDSGSWMERALELIAASEVALQAAEAQDTNAVFDAGERIYNACNDCHIQYRFIHDSPGVIRP